MCHKFLVLSVKKLLKSLYIYGSYRKIKTGVSLFLDQPVCLYSKMYHIKENRTVLGNGHITTAQPAVFTGRCYSVKHALMQSFTEVVSTCD